MISQDESLAKKLFFSLFFDILTDDNHGGLKLLIDDFMHTVGFINHHFSLGQSG